MKSLILVLVIAVAPLFCFSQSPQFAVVRPDGTTYICPTLDSAYLKATNGDYIYLPGGSFGLSYAINKKLYIFGAGHHPDSSLNTGRTSINNNISIESGASGGSIEGINMPSNYLNIRFHYTGNKIKNYTIKRCRINGYIDLDDGNSQLPLDSFPTNVFISECVVLGISCGSGNSIGNYFSKNIIRFNIVLPNFCSIKNNIFLTDGFAITVQYSTSFNNNNIENNIFLSPSPLEGVGCNNNYYNNLKKTDNPFLYQCSVSNGSETGTIAVPNVDAVFVSFDPTYANFPYLDNYHLKPTCPGINAGTDGTDVGIYGTVSPTLAGWVPSNPHIYFKQVAPQTNSSGQLQIQIKVRTNN
jgi:hypothetical protein